jgi:hypothetical protein
MKYSELNNEQERDESLTFFAGLFILCYLLVLVQCEQHQKKRAQIEAEARQNEHNKLFTTLDSDAIETLEPFDIDTNRLTK